jgi:hypothetical protein
MVDSVITPTHWADSVGLEGEDRRRFERERARQLAAALRASGCTLIRTPPPGPAAGRHSPRAPSEPARPARAHDPPPTPPPPPPPPGPESYPLRADAHDPSGDSCPPARRN